MFPSEDQSELIFNPAKMSDEGKCTCHAKGLGTEDSAEFTIKGAVEKDLVKAKKDTVEFEEGGVIKLIVSMEFR
jgi:hypothetical protein